jgi:hypothetical protein
MLYEYKRGGSQFVKDISYYSEPIRIGKTTIFPENPKIPKNSRKIAPKFDFALAINIDLKKSHSHSQKILNNYFL